MCSSDLEAAEKDVFAHDMRTTSSVTVGATTTASVSSTIDLSEQTSDASIPLEEIETKRTEWRRKEQRKSLPRTQEKDLSTRRRDDTDSPG